MTANMSSDADPRGKVPGLAASRGLATPSGLRATAAAAGLVVSDLAMAGLSANLASTFLPAAAQGTILHLFAVAVAAQLVLKSAFDLYPGFGLHPEARLRRASLAWGAAALLAGIAGLLLTGATATPLALVTLLFATTAPLQGIGRLLVLRLLRRRALWGLPVQVLGDPETVPDTIRFLERHSGYGLVPVQEGARLALWASRVMPDPATLHWLRRSYPEILLLSDLPGLALSGIRPAEHGGTIGLRLIGSGALPAMSPGKRLFDLAIAAPCSLIAAPMIALAALMIRMADSGGAFFTQQRDGLRGQQIGVLKLRTMYRDADKMLEALLARDPEARAEWESHFKLRHDPRILPVVGRILRATSLDELPQIWNILRGDMSLVGPRPFPAYHLEAMTPEFRHRRATLVPGLTGLWQISERSDGDLARQEALDGYYIDNRSFWMDLSILLRTFGAVITGRGAY